MTRTIALTAALLAAALPAAAQGPATISGQVYACGTGRPLAGAAVRLRGLDDGGTIALTSGRDGRFSRVGLTPGRYLIEATAPLPARPPGSGHWFAPTASRLARVENDDFLTVRIGAAAPSRFHGVGPARRPGADESTQPRPACDEPLVPPAVPTSDRTIIH